MKKRITRGKARQWYVRAMAMICACAIIVPSISASAANAGYLTDRVEHTDLSFDECEFVRMNIDDFTSIVDGLEDLTADAANVDDVESVVIAMEDYYNEVVQNYSLANVYSTLYVDDDSYDEDVKFCDELATEVSDQIMQCYHMIAISPCADMLEERIDNADDWDDILNYEPMTQEQKDLVAQETELSLEYDSLSIADYYTEINGVSYTQEELDAANESGSIAADEYMIGFADIMTQRNQAMGELYLELVDVRKQIATSYGYDNYVDYAYDKTYGRDYTHEDLDEYRDQVIEYMAPLQDELYEMLMGTYASDYEDMFSQEMSPEECLAILEEYIPEISDDLMVSYQYMIDHNMYDIEVSDTKAPGAYTTTLTGYNAPFLFNCADGTISDMSALIHEFGHYNEMYYASEDTWYYDHTDLDLAEIHSQGLELLYMEYYDDIFGDYSEVMKLYSLFNMVYIAIEGVKEDEFQYEVYSSDSDLTISDLNKMYYDCCVTYGDEDLYNSYYLGYYGVTNSDEILEWVEIPHTFQSPLYYVSYSVSVAAVDELNNQILDDRQTGIDIYLDLVDREFQDSFQNTITDAGLNNPIAEPRFDVYADDIRYLAGLPSDRADAASAAPSSTPSSATPASSQPSAEPDDDTDVDTTETEEEAVVSGILIAIIIGAVIALAIVILVIVLIVKSCKKKEANKAQQIPQMNQNPAQPMYGQQSMPMQQNNYGTQSSMQSQYSGIQPPQFGQPTAPQAPVSPYAQPTAQQTPVSPYAQPTVQQAPVSPYAQPTAQQAPVSQYAQPTVQQVPETSAEQVTTTPEQTNTMDQSTTVPPTDSSNSDN